MCHHISTGLYDTGADSGLPVKGSHSLLTANFDPNSFVGDKLEWKNAQKNYTKNIISETINRIIPHRNPFVTTVFFDR